MLFISHQAVYLQFGSLILSEICFDKWFPHLHGQSGPHLDISQTEASKILLGLNISLFLISYINRILAFGHYPPRRPSSPRSMNLFKILIFQVCKISYVFEVQAWIIYYLYYKRESF